MPRKSLIADLANSICKESIGNQLLFKILQRDPPLITPFSGASQVGNILHEALVVGNRYYHSHFFTFLVGTADGFAVVRDPIACKHAVMAETDDWVAMATEWRAIAHLPGADTARVWEPEPATIYTWGGHA